MVNGFWLQTTATFIELKTEKLSPESELLIQAVGENGTLAEEKLTIHTMYGRYSSRCISGHCRALGLTALWVYCTVVYPGKTFVKYDFTLTIHSFLFGKIFTATCELSCFPSVSLQLPNSIYQMDE